MTTEKINGRDVLTAGEGKRITNGEDICGKKVILAVGTSVDGFHEITEEEYQSMFVVDENLEIM